MIRTTLAQTRQFVLQKNFLTGQNEATLQQLAAEMAGIPADPRTTPFISAYVRLNDFSPADLTAEMQQQHLMKGLLMRNSPFLVLPEQYPALFSATARQRNQAFNAEFRLWGIEHNETMERLAEAIVSIVGERVMTAAAISDELEPALVQTLTQTSRGGRVSSLSNVDLALRWLTARGILYGADAATEWREENLSYGCLEQWYPELDLTDAPSEAVAQKLLVRCYLAAFGPATEADISFWTGLGKSETARATNALSGETTLAMVDGIPGMLLMLKDQAGALQAVEPPVSPLIKLLPANDPYATAYRASRSRYFSDQTLQRRVFNNAGEAKPAILVDGIIVGVWDWQTQAGQDEVAWRLFARIDNSVETQIRAVVERVAAFIHPETVVRQQVY